MEEELEGWNKGWKVVNTNRIFRMKYWNRKRESEKSKNEDGLTRIGESNIARKSLEKWREGKMFYKIIAAFNLENKIADTF